jgi:deoxyadenosine/deoxycytidine kinase
MFGPVVWVEGIIGSGKTTLAELLAQKLGLRLIQEPVETNPYLERFYKDPKRWAFSMQVELLHRRFAMQKLASYEATGEGGYAGAVLDRGLPGDRVFAKLHMLEGNMADIEWETYAHAADVMSCSLVSPSLMIYLDVEPEVALHRIQARARGAESGMKLDYLEKLRRGYLDLLVEIQSGSHAWSRGMEVMRLAWNIDDQPTEKLVEALRDKFKLTPPAGA